jgi:hypothetical protein
MTATITINGETLPAEVCPQCGMRIYPASALKDHVAHHSDNALVFGSKIRPQIVFRKRKIVGGIMKKILLALALFCSFAVSEAASAQTLNINTAKMNWSWSQGTGALADGFVFKCGTATGVYTRSAQLPGSTVRSASVSSVINANGNWFCVVTAYVQPTGAPTLLESSPSNEVTSFFAGAAVAATGASFSAQ